MFMLQEAFPARPGSVITQASITAARATGTTQPSFQLGSSTTGSLSRARYRQQAGDKSWCTKAWACWKWVQRQDIIFICCYLQTLATEKPDSQNDCMISKHFTIMSLHLSRFNSVYFLFSCWEKQRWINKFHGLSNLEDYGYIFLATQLATKTQFMVNHVFLFFFK